MKQESDKQEVISPRQSASIISSTIIGAGVLTLPRVSAEFAKQSGWFSVILGALLAMFCIAVITVLSRKFPGQSMVSYSEKILGSRNGKVIGKFLSFPLLFMFVVYWGFSTVIVARMFGEVVITTVLTRTPLEVIISTMLLTALVLTLYNVEVLARVNEILLPIIVFPVIVIAISSYQSAKLYYIFPLRDGIDLSDLLIGVMGTSVSFLGFEVMTMFLAHTQQSTKLLRLNLMGIAIPGIIYTLIVFSGIAVFGVDELKLLAWPTLELVKVTEVPGLILERLESAFLGVWVAAVFTTTGNLYYATSLLLKQLLRRKGHRTIAVLMLPIFYWLSLLPPNIHALFQYQSYTSYFGGVITFGFPLLLLIVAWARKLGGKGRAVR